jgi:hypothetical protein
MRSVIGAHAPIGAAVARAAVRITNAIGGRLEQMTYEEQMRMREAAAPLAKLLWIGCIKGSEGRPRF